jgi:hypothetical protein
VPLVAGEHGERGLGDVSAGDSGVLSQYGIGCQADSSIASMAARTLLVLPRGDREADVELHRRGQHRLGE